MEPTNENTKMEYQTKPTPRMIATVKNLTDDDGNPRSMRAAMIAAGYSEHSANNSQRLTNSQAFKTLMVQMGLTADELIECLREGLHATHMVVKLEGLNDKGKRIEVSAEAPDWQTRHKYFESALKLWGLPSVDPAPGPGQNAGTINNYIDARQQQKNEYNI